MYFPQKNLLSLFAMAVVCQESEERAPGARQPQSNEADRAADFWLASDYTRFSPVDQHPRACPIVSDRHPLRRGNDTPGTWLWANRGEM